MRGEAGHGAGVAIVGDDERADAVGDESQALVGEAKDDALLADQRLRAEHDGARRR